MPAWIQKTRGAGSPVAQPVQVPAQIPAVIEDLRALNLATEREFLDMGGKLTSILAKVNRVSSDLTGLGELMSGESGEQASAVLSTALGYSEQMRQQAQDGSMALLDMRHQVGQLRRTLGGFQQIASTMLTLGVLTRVETARLGHTGADFTGFADTVKALAIDSQTKVQTALETAAILIPPIEEAMNSTATFTQGEAKELPEVIEEVTASLAVLRGIRERALRSSNELAALSRQISAAFGQLIVSLQFHDIVRQQVEHVIEALRMIHEETGGGAVSESRHVAILVLQSSQLAGAAERFSAAASAVGSGLKDIGASVTRMAEESRTMAGNSGKKDGSIFVDMERGCAGILENLRHFARNEASKRGSCGKLSGAVSSMRRCLDEIRDMEIRVQRTALNAGIRAAHIGGAGVALSVLAGSMQQLTMDSAARSDLLDETLNSMSEASSRLAGEARSGADTGDLELERVLCGMRSAIEELHSSDEKSYALMARIVQGSADVLSELEAARDGFTAGGQFAEVTASALARLREMGADGASWQPAECHTASLAGLARLADQYTMQSEREIHASLANGNAAVEASAVNTPSVAGADSEFGDNVELF